MAEALYPSEFCQEYDLVNTVWFQLALQDEACELNKLYTIEFIDAYSKHHQTAILCSPCRRPWPPLP